MGEMARRRKKKKTVYMCAVKEYHVWELFSEINRSRVSYKKRFSRVYAFNLYVIIEFSPGEKVVCGLCTTAVAAKGNTLTHAQTYTQNLYRDLLV